MNKTKCSEFIDNVGGLNVRIGTNAQYGDNDLTTWLINHLDVKPGEHVLDIGCDGGAHLRKVASIVGKDDFCFGIDYDRQMIDKAKKDSENFKPCIIFQQMDMDTTSDSNPPFKNDYFDLIYSVYAFYYSKNEIVLLNTLREKIKKNGRIAIVGPYGDNNKQWFEFLTQFMELPKPVIGASSTFMDGIKMYADENFEIVKTSEFINNITLPSFEVLKNYWTSNIYHDPKYDQDFEKYARKHFKKNKSFKFFKKAKIIMMKNKFK